MSVTDSDADAGNTVPASGLRDDEVSLTEDEIFHLLQNQRRRNVLRYLRGTDEPVRMRDIAEQIAAWEHDTTVDALTSNQRQRVYIPLYQSHLPKLDEEGIIDYQKSRGIVQRKPRADLLDLYLNPGVDTDEIDDDTAREWNDYYLVAIGVASIALFGAILEVPIFSALSGITIGALIILVFTFLLHIQYINA